MVGDGAQKKKIQNMANDKSLQNIYFLDQRPKKEIPDILNICDLGLVILNNVELFKSVIPSKIFEYFALALPVIMSMPKGEATKIIDTFEAGVIVQPESGKALAAAILKLYKSPKVRKEMSKNSKLASQHFKRIVQARKMLKFITKGY